VTYAVTEKKSKIFKYNLYYHTVFNIHIVVTILNDEVRLYKLFLFFFLNPTKLDIFLRFELVLHSVDWYEHIRDWIQEIKIREDGFRAFFIYYDCTECS
jgi:hypothetical protein